MIGCHPVTGVLCRLGLLSLPLQNSVSSARSEGCRTENQPGGVNVVPTGVSVHRWSIWDNLCLLRKNKKGQCNSHCSLKELLRPLPALYRLQVPGPSRGIITASFSPLTAHGSGKTGGCSGVF